MPKNVELKAKLKDIERAVKIAENLCQTDAKVLHQEDTFFNASTGRLKLRKFQVKKAVFTYKNIATVADPSTHETNLLGNLHDDSVAQLIHYNRPNIAGLKTSKYSICFIKNHQELLHVLKSALGIRGIVRKTRFLFLYGQTRIHIDKVEGLGSFLEFEVVLNTNQTEKEGEEEGRKLMQKFEISEEDLIEGAYIDLILNK